VRFGGLFLYQGGEVSSVEPQGSAEELETSELPLSCEAVERGFVEAGDAGCVVDVD